MPCNAICSLKNSDSIFEFANHVMATPFNLGFLESLGSKFDFINFVNSTIHEKNSSISCTALTKTQFFMRRSVAAVIICFKFYRNLLRGFRAVRGQNGDLPLTLTVALTTGEHYRAACDHTVLPATHTRTIPAFTSQLKGVTAVWLVLIAPSHEGMARLS